MTPVASIIIVTWNALDHLKTFLPSVVASAGDDVEIILADNASTDGSAEWVHNEYPHIRIIHHPENYGYCGGNNKAAIHAKGETLIFLNNDVSVEKDWLDPLLRVFESSNIAAAQPKIRSYASPDQFEYAGAAGGFLDKNAYPFCRGRIFHSMETDRGQYDTPSRLFWASGAAFAVRKDLFLEADGFDKDFRFHMEEIDFCWRMLNRGYEIHYVPQSVVYHLGGGSLPSHSARKTYYNFRNSLLMIWKNATSRWLFRRFFLRLLYDGAAGVYALMKGNPADTLAIVKAHFHFYSSWGKVHRKRKELQKCRISRTEPEEMINVNVVVRHFLFGDQSYTELMGCIQTGGPDKKR